MEMMFDCGFSKENSRFRYRAGGLLIHDGKILFAKNAVGGYLYILGGGVHIRYDTVYDLVLIDLRSVLWNYRHNKKQFKAFLERKFQTDSAKEAKKLQAEYEKKQSRFEEIDRILCKLYEDSALGKIPESRYEAMSAQYTVITKGWRCL